MAIESTMQSTTSALPRRFGHSLQSLPALRFSQQERAIARFDGGCELDVLKEEAARGFTLSAEQEQFIGDADPATWQRPLLPLRSAAGEELDPAVAPPPRTSVYTKPLSEFAVAACPAYRRLPALQKECRAKGCLDLGGPCEKVCDSSRCRG